MRSLLLLRHKGPKVFTLTLPTLLFSSMFLKAAHQLMLSAYAFFIDCFLALLCVSHLNKYNFCFIYINIYLFIFIYIFLYIFIFICFLYIFIFIYFEYFIYSFIFIYFYNIYF